MGIPIEFLVAGGLVILAVVILMVSWSKKAREVDLADSEGGAKKPEWVRTTPPDETSSQLKADGEKFGVFDQDKGEEMASPFAEQIEDIIRVLLRQDPDLAGVKVDLGSAADGSLEIWIDEELFTSVDDISNDKIKQVFRKAISRWEASQ
jgi:hypothetical protein